MKYQLFIIISLINPKELNKVLYLGKTINSQYIICYNKANVSHV